MIVEVLVRRSDPVVKTLVLASALFIVCAGFIAPDHAGAAGVRSACASLGPADIQAVLGGSVGQGDLTSAPDGSESICQWTVAVGNGRTGFGLQLDLKASFTKQMFQQQRRIASRLTKRVTHLGDSAFFERSTVAGQTYDDLWVHAGDVAFRVEALKRIGPGPLVTLARTVLTRLAGTTGS
jgi:hypothetical protein